MKQYFGDVPKRETLPGISMRQKFVTLTPRQLIGPLNDVERKYAPSEIFAAGPMETPLPRPRVAMVGSRKASVEGLKTATDIAATLSRKGIVIVSGLAEGIDTAAHRAALEHGGRTIAVLGTPWTVRFPRKIRNSRMRS